MKLPVIATMEAPIDLATKTRTWPIGPAPKIRTFDPIDTSALLHAWTPTDKGSIKAPSSKDNSSGILKVRKKKYLYGN